MRLRIAARKIHKWVALLVGLQVVIWSLTGLYMTAVHIDTIHGDHLVRAPGERNVDVRSLVDPMAVASMTGAENLRLAWLGNEPIYVAKGNSGEVAVHARTGRTVARPTQDQINAIATGIYTGTERIRSIELIDTIPGEIRGRAPPLWRVEFDHWNKPTFYLSPVTGELVSRRHELWRAFDFLWMLHIMDYKERENVNNAILRVFTWGALLMALTGAWMLLYAFPKKKKKAAGR